MKKSKVCHAMTLPPLVFGVPRDYMAFAFFISIAVGGFGGLVYFQNGLGAMLATIPFALVFWAIGFFMTSKDSEFFSVWRKNCFQLGKYVALDGKRSYEP